MKKNLFIAIFCMAFSSLSFGQLRVLVPGASHLLNNGDTVKVYGNDINEMSIDLNVVNTGASIPSVSAKRDSLFLPMKDTDNEFCWGGFCYGTSTNVSTLSETLNHNDTTSIVEQFQGHYFPYGHLGAAFIRYTFYNKANPSSNDSGWVVVEYDATPTGVQNISGSISFAAPYPNPAGSSVNFNYSFSNVVQSANLKVFNLLGECVQTFPLSTLKNKTTVNVQYMPSGIYVCEIDASGCQPVYQKIVVSH
jgi:hypothetical protein